MQFIHSRSVLRYDRYRCSRLMMLACGMRCRPLLCFGRLIHLLRLGRRWWCVSVRTFSALQVNKPNRTFHFGQQTTDRVQIRCRHVSLSQPLTVVSFVNRFWAQLFVGAPDQCTAVHNPVTPIQQREIQIRRRLRRAHHSWTMPMIHIQTNVVLVFSFFSPIIHCFSDQIFSTSRSVPCKEATTHTLLKIGVKKSLLCFSASFQILRQ